MADGGEARAGDERGARALEVILRVGIRAGQTWRAAPRLQPAFGPRLVADGQRHGLHLLALAYAESGFVPPMLQQRLAEVRRIPAFAEAQPEIEVLARITARVVAARDSKCIAAHDDRRMRHR